MGLAEDNAVILSRYLAKGKKPTAAEVRKSRKHGVSREWTPGGSMNWWVLGAGVRFAFGDKSEWEDVLYRLTKESTEWGTWGTEQHSPIYWGFHLIGRISMAKNLQPDDAVFKLIVDQLADLMVYCYHALSPSGREVMWAGMRGCGHEEWASYELWWLFTKYMLDQNPRKKKSWRNDVHTMWVPSEPVRAIFQDHVRPLYEQKRQLAVPVRGVRSPTHFITFGVLSRLVYTEKNQHGSTEFKGASGVVNGKVVNAPVNYQIRARGKGTSGRVTATISGTDEERLTLTYSGPYNDLPGARPVVFDEPVEAITDHVIWNAQGIYLPVVDLVDRAIPEPERPSFWERIKRLFS